MCERNACDQAIVKHRKHHAGQPAIASCNRAQTVCKAEADDNGLRIDGGCEIRTERRAERLCEKCRRHVARHNRPDVCRMASLEAAADHAEYAAERRRIPLCADEVIVEHDEQTIDCKIQNGRPGAVFCAVIRAEAGILQQLSVLPEAAAKAQTQNQRQHKHRDAEYVADGPVPVACANAHTIRQRSAQHAVKYSPQEKRCKADRNRGRVKVVALVHLRAVCKPRRQNESDHSADQKRQDRAKQCYAARLCARIPDEKICHQGRNAGGKQKDIALRVELYLTDKAADQHTCKAEPDIQHRNAPEAEARRQEIGKHRNAVRLAAGKRVDRRADSADDCRIQKCTGKAAVCRVKIAVGRLIRQRTQPQHSFDHLPPVGHGNCRKQTGRSKQPEKKPDRLFRLPEFFFHQNSSPS